MKLLFKQKVFSWFGSYDVFDESGNIIYKVKGELSWGHMLRIYDRNGFEVGVVKQKVFTWLPKFEIYSENRYLGCINKEFSFFKPRFNIDYNGWHIDGDWLEWDYSILNANCHRIATVTKQPFNWTDTYVIDVEDENDALCALMLVIAIDAEKCSRNS